MLFVRQSHSLTFFVHCALLNDDFLGIDSARPPVLFSRHDVFNVQHHYDGYHYHPFTGGSFVLSSGAENSALNQRGATCSAFFIPPPLPSPNGRGKGRPGGDG